MNYFLLVAIAVMLASCAEPTPSYLEGKPLPSYVEGGYVEGGSSK